MGMSEKQGLHKRGAYRHSVMRLYVDETGEMFFREGCVRTNFEIVFIPLRGLKRATLPMRSCIFILSPAVIFRIELCSSDCTLGSVLFPQARELYNVPYVPSSQFAQLGLPSTKVASTGHTRPCQWQTHDWSLIGPMTGGD
jgi:hypothetical protein